MSFHQRLIGPICALASAFGFSAKSIFIKAAYLDAGVDAVTLMALRMLFALPFFLLMLWYGGRQPGARPLQHRDWWNLIWLAFTGYYLASFLDFRGLEYISAGLERLILFLYPAMVLVLSAVFLGRAVHGREILAVVLCFLGIACAFAGDLRITESPRALWIGGGLVLASALAYSAYLVGNVRVLHRLGAMRFTGASACLSSIFVLGHFLMTRPARDLVQPVRVQLLVAGLALFATAAPIWLSSEAIRRIGPSRFALIGSIGPILTIWMGAALLDEPVTVFQILGAALVLAGVALVAHLDPET